MLRKARLGASIAAALVVAPTFARASEVFFICKDDAGKSPAYLRVDIAHKKVTGVMGEAPVRCTISFVDGVYGPVFGAPPGDTCVMLALNGDGQPPVHQSVGVRGNVVSFGGVNENATITETLDMDSGVWEMPNGIEECHRPRS